MVGYSDVLIGLQYGDEGKGKIVARLACQYDVVARFNGGGNAGHTHWFNGKKIALHQIPSGIIEPEVISYIASGCVINLEQLVAELATVQQFVNTTDRLFISSQTTVVQPHHILLDRITSEEIGTTGNGIGPAYADRALRKIQGRLKNIQVHYVLSHPQKVKEIFADNYQEVMEKYVEASNQKHATVVEKLGDVKQQIEKLISSAHELKKYVSINPLWLEERVRKGKKVLFEGAQAAGLDVVTGNIPYVTSSHTNAGAAYAEGDLPPKYHRRTYGVAKAIMTRVGAGPFASEFGGLASEAYCTKDNGKAHAEEFEKTHYNAQELLNSRDHFEIGIALRMIGKEYGATTGRPRRTGMLDLVQLRQNCRYNGVDEIYINKIDCLSDFSKTKLPGIPLVVAYELDDRRIDYVPPSTDDLRMITPIIDHVNHIPQFNAKQYNELPTEVKQLITRIEQETGCTVKGIGTGPEKEQIIEK